LEPAHAGFQRTGSASPSLGDALNAGFLYLEVRCLGCDTHQTVALNVVRRPKPTPIRREAKAIAISQAFRAKRRIAIHDSRKPAGESGSVGCSGRPIGANGWALT
jgi:hypothetical protein